MDRALPCGRVRVLGRHFVERAGYSLPELQGLSKARLSQQAAREVENQLKWANNYYKNYSEDNTRSERFGALFI